jgi:hypothetical protein
VAAPASAPHGGFAAASAFADSRFCSACHQFPADGPRTAGKLHEDVYGQWLATPSARGGQSCQACHMPQRQHLWHGIHHPDMLRQALTVDLRVVRSGDNALQAQATLRNTGAGHHLPTYMVPKLECLLVLVGPDGRDRGVLARHVIGWQIDAALSAEAFDTRLPAGAAVTLRAVLPRQASAESHVELRVVVAPREHYERMFQQVLGRGAALDDTTRRTLTLALQEARAQRYEALRVAQPLPARR